MTTMSVADFKSHFSEVLTGLLSRQERVVVERRGKPVAVLVSVEDAERLGLSGSAPPRGILGILGAWAEHPDIDAFVDEIYAARDAAEDRDVEPLA
jgi:prevent-host-death family protein